MSAAVCPSCGVAVVPGYVRCPKCHKALPRRKSTIVEGGTAVDRRGRLSLVALAVVGVTGIAIIAYLGLRGGDKPAPAVTAPTETPDQTPTETTPAGPDTTDTTPTPNANAAPDPDAVADSLERTLKRERLWSTVSVEGARVDVRSGSCSDPKMRPLLEASAASFKAAGLTKLRCLEQSGQVVSDRDL
jgi:hypothetical protein